MQNTEVILDEDTLQKIKVRVMKLEIDNARMKIKNDKKILDEIIKIIEEEAGCSLES